MARLAGVRKLWSTARRILWPPDASRRTQLAHTLLATLVGAFLGLLLGSLQSERAAKASTLTRLALVRREAEANWDTALRVRDVVVVDAKQRVAVMDRFSLTMALAALQDDRVMARLPPEVISLIEVYVRAGSLVVDLQDRYNRLVIEWAAVVPGNVPPGAKELSDSLRYNAAAFAAAGFVLGEELAKHVDITVLDRPTFRDARRALEKRMRDVVQGILDGRAERPAPVERLKPTAPK